jgi:multiple sugar transport system substrate-binding protein
MYFQEDHYERLVETFSESHPHIIVELSPRFWSGPRAGLNTRDVDVLTVMEAELIGLQARGEILSLDPFIDRDESFDPSDLYASAAGLFTVENQMWAVPAGVDPLVMYYNKDLFDRYGVSYPEIGWTWDDFLDAALAVRDSDANVFGYAPHSGRFDAMLFVYQHGGRIYDSLQNPTRTTFDDPLTIEALDWYARLYHDYDVAPTTKQALKAFRGGRESGIPRGIFDGQVGMWFGTLSGRGGEYWQYLLWDWDFEWGMVLLLSDAQYAAGAYAEGYAVSSATSHPDACWQWIRFLSEQMTDRLMPARRSLVESAECEKQSGKDVVDMTRMSMENVPVLSPGMFSFGNAGAIFGEAVDKIVDDGIVDDGATAHEAMDWAQRQAQSRDSTGG